MNITKSKKQKLGKVIILAPARPWPQEIRVARILAEAGFTVRFIPEKDTKTPDIYLNQTMFEIKSPTSALPKAVQRNLTKALAKCPNVIFDSSRMKLDDRQIYKELIKLRKRGKGLKRLLFIDKSKKIIDIELSIKNKKR